MPDPSNAEIRLVRPPEKFWDRLETWHKALISIGGIVALVFGAGMATAKIRSSVVMATDQKVIDTEQDRQIRALMTDSGVLHVTIDDLHDEVRGMRTDLRFFDPRLRGGGLPALPEESPRVTPTMDPSMGFAVPTASEKPKRTP